MADRISMETFPEPKNMRIQDSQEIVIYNTTTHKEKNKKTTKQETPLKWKERSLTRVGK